MTAVDFVLYCAGSGLLMLSAAGAFRLLMGDKKPTPPPPPVEQFQQKPEEVSPDLGLTDRLRRFQEQRFASPIINRQLEREGYSPSPGEPGGRRVVPPIRQLRPLRPVNPPSGRTFSAPKQPPKKESSNVVPFPQKQAKPDDPPKED